MASDDSIPLPTEKSVIQRLEDWGTAVAAPTSRGRFFALRTSLSSDLNPGEKPLAYKALLLLFPSAASSLPPSLLATLVTALHARPVQAVPLIFFTPTLLFSSYLNLSGFTTASAGLTAAWSGLYALLALRRRQGLRAKLTPRGFVRGSAIGLGAANAVAGGLVYMKGDFKADDERRRERKRWTSE